MNANEDHAKSYRQLREERRPDDRQRWILLIKELRAAHSCDIYSAERIALLDPILKRWVESQINHDQRCARMARSHIRINGDNTLVIEKDGKLVVRS